MNTFEVRNGYRATEKGLYRNPQSIGEMVSHCSAHSHIEVLDLNGNARRVKVNGKVRTWKKDASRVEIPCKYGLYEYFTLTGHDINQVLIPVPRVPSPEVETMMHMVFPENRFVYADNSPVPVSQGGEMIVTFTWGHVNPKPGFVSAWDAARIAFGTKAFDVLSRAEQIAAVRQYVSR